MIGRNDDALEQAAVGLGGACASSVMGNCLVAGVSNPSSLVKVSWPVSPMIGSRM